MVYGIDLGGDSELYFYKEGNYHIEHKNSVSSKAVENDRIITYDLYKADGEMISKTYDNGGKYYDANTAASEVSHKPTGWYKITSKTIEPEYVLSNRDMTDVVLYNPKNATFPDENIKNVYVLNAETYHDEFQENIYTTVDKVGGIILSGAKVIDTVDCGLDSVNDIARACAAGHLVRISYTYKTTGSGSYEVKTIFITGFTPDAGIKVSTGSGKNLVVNYTGDGYLYIFTRHGYKPTPAVVAEAVKAELERYGFQNVTAQVENIANTGVTTWKVEGMWNGVKYVFTGTGEFTRSTAEIVVNNKISYVWVDGKLTAERLGLANGDYKINQTTVDEKGDEEKRAGYVRVTTVDGKKVVAFYDTDGTARPDLTSFNDFIIAGDVVVFTTVNNFKPAEPTTIQGEVSESLTGVTATFNGLAAGEDISASVGAPVTIEITGAAAAPESRAAVTTFEDGKVYTVTINGAEYPSTAAKDNKITVTYTIKSGDTKIEITDIVEKVETVEGAVTVEVKGAGDAGTYTADPKTLTEAGKKYTITITDAAYKAGDTYTVADEGVTGTDNGDGTITVTYTTPAEIPAEGMTLTITVTKTAFNGGSDETEGVEATVDINGAAMSATVKLGVWEKVNGTGVATEEQIKAALLAVDGVTAVKNIDVAKKTATLTVAVGDVAATWTETKLFKVTFPGGYDFVGGDFKVMTGVTAGVKYLVDKTAPVVNRPVNVTPGADATKPGSVTFTTAPTEETEYEEAFKVTGDGSDTTIAGPAVSLSSSQKLLMGYKNANGTPVSVTGNATAIYVAKDTELVFVKGSGLNDTEGSMKLKLNNEEYLFAIDGDTVTADKPIVVSSADDSKEVKLTLFAPTAAVVDYTITVNGADEQVAKTDESVTFSGLTPGAKVAYLNGETLALATGTVDAFGNFTYTVDGDNKNGETTNIELFTVYEINLATDISVGELYWKNPITETTDNAKLAGGAATDKYYVKTTGTEAERTLWFKAAETNCWYTVASTSAKSLTMSVAEGRKPSMATTGGEGVWKLVLTGDITHAAIAEGVQVKTDALEVANNIDTTAQETASFIDGTATGYKFKLTWAAEASYETAKVALTDDQKLSFTADQEITKTAGAKIGTATIEMTTPTGESWSTIIIVNFGQ